ncbi:transglutaminase domain-containing protein [Patescibacteria group bacterium]|nr:transglutaminase domain-containing protein [Patescibacteria group bacterium]
MRFLKHLLSGFVFCLSIVAFMGLAAWLQPVSADENFEIGLTSSYIIKDNGLATIEQQFTLTNKKPTLYASQYAIEVGSSKIQNVRVFDRNGPIPANIVNTDKKTSIAINFEDIIVGEGKRRQFTVQFESPDIAIISGNVVEVYIPRFSDLARYDAYKVELRVPDRFGQPARVNPPASSVELHNGYTVLTFDNLGDQGVTALFGEKQIYDFMLRYHLENPTTSIGLAQIALPPDTTSQKVQYLSLEPRPKQLAQDPDGNWIATYEVSAGKETEVQLSGKAMIYLSPQDNMPQLPALKDHLVGQKFWQTDDSRIARIAQENPTPRQIYDYVVNSLTYNFAKVNGPVTRLGASEALSDPFQAACQEFTDLFVAVARAAGIPARRVTGYAYTENSRLRPLSLVDDILHAWPEYYDAETQRWIAVDPTWGNTTGGLDYFSQLDFNHVAFAINGVSDSLPYPAGSYKRSTEKTKDVEVSFGSDEPLPPLSVEYTISKKPFWLSPFRNQYTIFISNNTGVAWYNIPLQASVDLSTVQVAQLPESIPTLLPYQTIEVPLELQGADWLRRRPVLLTLNLQGLLSTHELRTGIQIIETLKSAPINPIGLGIGLVVAAVITGGLLVFRRKR